MRNSVALVLVFLFTVSKIHAGIIKGSVKDSTNGAPLGGVVVSIPILGIGVQSDPDGLYELTDVPAGRHEVNFNYVTYSKLVRTVSIKANETLVLDVVMTSEKSQLKEVAIKSSKITNTENAVLLEIRQSNLIVSGVSATQISKTMDRSAADVVKRIPGVTILEDRFIMVRGLYDRYNTTWLNDVGAPSAEVDKKSFSFDLIPSGQIDRILVFKTSAPELPGDFAGGMVKIYTSSLPEKNQISAGFQTSYREHSTGTVFNHNPIGKTDWLGYDDGRRSIPNGLPEVVDKTDENITQITKSLNNNWAVFQKRQPVDSRFNLSIASAVKGNNIKFGNLFGLTYSNLSTNYEVTRRDFEVDTTTQKYHYEDQESANKATVSIMENASVSFGRSKIDFRNIYNQTGTAKTTIRRSQQFDTLAPQPDELFYINNYQSIRTFSSQLTGVHTSKSDNTKYNWGLGYTDLFRNRPDYMSIKYTKNYGTHDSMFMAAIPAGSVDRINGGGRFYSTLNERVYSFSHNLMQKINLADKYQFEINAGNYIESKDRSFKARTFGYTLQRSGNPNAFTILRTPINQIFALDNVGDTLKPKIEERTNKQDSYDGKNDLIASYISLSLPIGKRIKIVGGARYEINTQTLFYTDDNDANFKQETKTDFLLPSVNITFDLNKNSLVRAAYGKTLNRPEFREIAPFYFYDNEDIAGIYGSQYQSQYNPDGKMLNVAEIQNLDVRYELYPESGEMIQTGLFYKQFKNPIQKVFIPGGDQKDFTFINCKSADVFGIELDIRKDLEFVDGWLSTSFFKDLTIVSNLSLIKSHLSLGDSASLNLGVPVDDTRLQGQSPYVVNLGLYYQNADNGFKGSVLYNVFGPRIYALGVPRNGVNNLYETPFHSLDLVLEKNFLKHYSVNFGVQNLLDGTMRIAYDFDQNDKIMQWEADMAWKTFKPGRYFSLGVKVKF